MSARLVVVLSCAACTAPTVPPANEPANGSATEVAHPLAAPKVLAADATFGDHGRVLVSRDPGEHQLHDALARDDGILAVGYCAYPGTHDACVVLVDDHGTLDARFGDPGDPGIARIGTLSSFGTRLAVDATGRILVAGYRFAAGKAEDLLLARLSADGHLDPTFGTAGITTADFGNSDDRPSAVFPLPSGQILVVGIHSKGGIANGEYETYIARFDDRGQLDTTFGTAGVAFYDPVPGREFVSHAVLDRDGSIVLGGYLVGGGAFVARITEAGTPITSFGDAGVVVTHAAKIDTAWALALDARGRILLGGSSDDHGIVLRFTTSGAPDPDWGAQGTATGSKTEDQFYALLPDADGSVLGVGFRNLSSDAQVLLMRFGARGTLDTTHSLLGHERDEFAFGATVDRRGRVVVVGSHGRVGLVARFSLM